MNRVNDWRSLLAIANEDLAKIGYELKIYEEDGCYSCDIWKNGVAYNIYAENYYEDELSELINDAWHHVKTELPTSEWNTIHISCKADFTPDFLRQLANAIEMQEEKDNLHLETENGYADVMLWLYD